MGFQQSQLYANLIRLVLTSSHGR